MISLSLSLIDIYYWSDICITEEKAETEEGTITEDNAPEDENDVWKKLKDLAGYILLIYNSIIIFCELGDHSHVDSQQAIHSTNAKHEFRNLSFT